MLELTEDIKVEVAKFKGKTYASIRRWFLADDGEWYRTKNGLSLPIDDMVKLLGMSEEIRAYIEEEVNAIR